MVVGAPGSSSIAWSHIVCFGSRCDCSSLNTFLCLAYSLGREVWAVLIVMGVVLHRSICSCWFGRGWLTDRGRGIFLIGSRSHLAYSRLRKFSVAPESRREIVSALFAGEWMKTQTVIDLRVDIYT